MKTVKIFTILGKSNNHHEETQDFDQIIGIQLKKINGKFRF